jgi:hypothetical protein
MRELRGHLDLDAGHGAAGQPRLDRQLPGTAAAGVLDRVQAVRIGAVDPEPIGSEVFEGRCPGCRWLTGARES